MQNPKFKQIINKSEVQSILQKMNELMSFEQLKSMNVAMKNYFKELKPLFHSVRGTMHFNNGDLCLFN